MTNDKWITGTKKYADVGCLLKFDNGDYSQGYTQFRAAFMCLAEDKIRQLYASDQGFGSSNHVDDVCYNLHFVDIRYHKSFVAAQTKKVDSTSSECVPASVYRNVILLTSELIPTSSDGQHHFDL